MSWRDYYKNGFSSPFGACRPSGGNPCGRRHRGQDISHSSKPGTIAVPALHAGRVVGKLAPSPRHGFGHGIIIRSVLDGMEFDFYYAHGPWASSQRVGEWVTQGQIILHEGTSGATVGSCVHIEQQRVSTGAFINPRGEINAVANGRVTPGTGAPANNPPAQPARDDTPPPGEYNPFGIKWSKGFQKIAKHFGGYRGAIDGKWDVPNGGSIRGFNAWLRANGWYRGNDVPGVEWRKGVQRWLATRKSNPYRGKIDGVFGEGTKSSLYTAEAENYQQLS